MKPDEVKGNTFDESKFFDIYQGGCHLVALGGVLAFLHPELSVNQTVKVVDNLVKPISRGDEMFKYLSELELTSVSQHLKRGQSNPWPGWINRGWSECLEKDVNNRMLEMDLRIKMNDIRRDNVTEVIGVLERGGAIILTVKLIPSTSNDFHAICIGKHNNQYKIVDLNRKCQIISREFLEQFLLHPEYRFDYIHPNVDYSIHQHAQVMTFENY